MDYPLIKSNAQNPIPPTTSKDFHLLSYIGDLHATGRVIFHVLMSSTNPTIIECHVLPIHISRSQMLDLYGLNFSRKQFQLLPSITFLSSKEIDTKQSALLLTYVKTATSIRVTRMEDRLLYTVVTGAGRAEYTVCEAREETGVFCQKNILGKIGRFGTTF